MARKLPKLQRALDAPDLFSIAYGEIASSIYFALGIVAAYALGLTPLVLLATGLLFVIVALSYAEGTTTVRETGGAATLVRIAFNDLAGFVTGWALFLDYLIVMSLSALFLPHYLGAAFAQPWLTRGPWDIVGAIVVLFVIGAIRFSRRHRIYAAGIAIATLDLVTQVLLVVLGFALLFSTHALGRGTSLGTAPRWHDIAFAIPLAMLAYTGLETVANLAEETRRPGRDLPRSLFSAIAVVVCMYVLIAFVGLFAFPPAHGATVLGGRWRLAPLMGIVAAIGSHLPHWLAVALRVYVGVTGALILLAAATAAMSGFGRLAYSLGEHGQLPRVFGRLSRRTLVAPQTIVAAVLISSGLILVTLPLHHPVTVLAGLFSFGVLLAFVAAQLAVLKLRLVDPGRRRPFRVPFGIRVGGGELPIPTLVGVALTFFVWIVALATHRGARYGGPAWLAVGLVLYFVVRRARGDPLLAHVASADEQVLPETAFHSILVPMKLGQIGEEMLATAVKLAQERGAAVEALHVIRVPLDQPLDAELVDKEESAEASLAEAKLLGADHGVEVRGETIRARSIGDAIIDEARKRDVDLIVLGSAPRWRRQSRFFSPTVEYVLRKAPCEVLIVAFPQGVLEEDEVPA